MWKFLFLFLAPVFALADFYPNSAPHPFDTTNPSAPVNSDSANEAIYWLTMVDQIQYDGSYGEAGPLLQDVVTRGQWIAMMSSMRRPLGYVSQRTKRSQNVLYQLPQGTKGYFVILTYETSFFGKSNAVERVVLMLTDDNSWRVISYAIQ